MVIPAISWGTKLGTYHQHHQPPHSTLVPWTCFKACPWHCFSSHVKVNLIKMASFIPFIISPWLLHPRLTTNPFHLISWYFIQMLLVVGVRGGETCEQCRHSPWTPFPTQQSQAMALSLHHIFGEQCSKLSSKLSYLPGPHYLLPIGQWPKGSTNRS